MNEQWFGKAALGSMALVAAIMLIVWPIMDAFDDDATAPPQGGSEVPAVWSERALLGSDTLGATVTTTTTTTGTTTTTTTRPMPEIWVPGAASVACAYIDTLDGDRLLDRVRDADHCLPIARARLTIQTVDNDRWLDVPPYSWELFVRDVLHMLYVDSAESAGNVLANGQNWGCPRQAPVAGMHPDPAGIGPVTGRANCPYFQNKVPTGNLSHMAHLVCERSQRFLGVDCINPYDLEEAALLAFAMVYEKNRNGWFHWWHIHWGLNGTLSRHGIAPIWFCPPDDYWANVRGGRQECPVR